MARHAPRTVWTALRRGWWAPRARLATLAAVLLALVGGGVAWAIRGGPEPGSLPLRPPPAVVLSPPPALGSHGVVANPTPTATPGASTPARKVPRATVTPRRTNRQTTPTTPNTIKSRPPAPPPGPTLNANYVAGQSWDRGFLAAVMVRNPTSAAVRYEVRIVYREADAVRVTAAWNASVRPGDRAGVWLFTGGPVAPGGQAGFGFEATKKNRESANPTSCTITVING